jgi:hypothetical protein
VDREEIASLWEIHRQADWPRLPSSHEGELMTLDTVISGCAVFYLDNATGLDPQRTGMLEDCIEDLENLFGELNEETRPYFERAKLLAQMLLAATDQSSY